MNSADKEEGVNAFMQKRKPQFQDKWVTLLFLTTQSKSIIWEFWDSAKGAHDVYEAAKTNKKPKVDIEPIPKLRQWRR